jgi:hypothetical protein
LFQPPLILLELIAQHLHLPLDQGDGLSTFMGYVDPGKESRMFDKEIGMFAKVVNYILFREIGVGFV